MGKEFRGASARGKPHRAGLIGEYVYFLRCYKMWWLLPVFTLNTLIK